MANTVLQDAADFIVRSHNEDVDPDVIELSKRAIIDFIGCGIAGCHEDAFSKTYSWSRLRSRAETSHVFGQSSTLDVEHAAMCNAVAGHALDFDDTSWTTIGHPTIVAAPVALAVAEELGASGTEVLKAYAIGVEVGHKIAQLSMPEASENGWHTTSVYGVIIAAAVSAYLLKLDRNTVVNALGIAMSRAAGMRSNFGTMTKPLHAGLAAKSGMEAVGLARVGITASPSAYEGDDGFSFCFTGRISDEGVSFGTNWDLKENGLAFKLYPCCSGSHPAADLMLDLVNKDLIGADDIDQIQVGSSLLGPRELVNHCPQTPLEARFSMEFALAAILIGGQLTLDEFTSEFIQRADVQELMTRIRMEVDDELAKLGFIGTAPVKLKLLLKNGSIMNIRNDLAWGNPSKPLQDSDLKRKFLQNASPVITVTKAEKILEQLFQLDTVIDIKELMTLTK